MDSKKYGKALVRLYYIGDKLYKDKSADAPERPSQDRYKAQFSYAYQRDRFSVISEFNKFSDKDFMKDFFEREYDKEPHPLSYTIFDYAFSNSSLSLLAQKRANHFFEEIEYLPQLEYDFFNQRIGNSNFYFKSDSLAGSLYKKFDSTDSEEPDEHALRIHSHNVLSYHKRIGFLNVIPYVGNYSTFYSRNIYSDRNLIREAFEGGVEASTTLYKTYNTDFNLFSRHIDKVRHVVTPTVKHVYIHGPSVSKDSLYQFDDIDDLEREQKVVFTLENKLQAKNKKEVWDLFYFSPSVEYKIEDPNKGSYFSKVTSDFEFYPTKSLSISGDANYDIVDRAFKEANIDINFKDTKNDRYKVSFGHRYSRGYSNQGTVDLSVKLTPKWQFKSYLRYEYSTGKFQEQQYILRRDLHCWWMDLGLDVDDDKNFTLWVIFRVKAFPSVHIGFDQTYHGGRKSYE